MKTVKILSLILVALLVLALCVSLVGCNNKKTEETDTKTTESDADNNGGWTNVEDGTITEAHKEMFKNASQDTVGVSYTPIKLIATQVVSGTNYKFLCEQTIVTAEATKVQKYVTIYRDLSGNCSITDVEDVAE